MLMEVSEGFQEDAVQALFDTPVASSEASSVLLARGSLRERLGMMSCGCLRGRQS